MQFKSKLIRAGNEVRLSRFHTLRGELISKREMIALPFELILRLIGFKRRGPWLSKSAVKELSRLLKGDPKKRVLEIGGGKSTYYFSKRTSFLMTIEEDPEWASRIQRQIAKENCEFELVNSELEDWLLSRTKHNMNFDIVLIDGGTDRARKKALEILPILNSKAIYILDNSDRTIFHQIHFHIQPVKIVRYSGMIRHPFQATETTFFYF